MVVRRVFLYSEISAMIKYNSNVSYFYVKFLLSLLFMRGTVLEILDLDRLIVIDGKESKVFFIA